jgi:hypothetical protein
MQVRSSTKGHQSSCGHKVLPVVVWQYVAPVCQRQRLAWATHGGVPPYAASGGAAPACACTVGNDCLFARLIAHPLLICTARRALIACVHGSLCACHTIITCFHGWLHAHCPIIAAPAHRHVLLRQLSPVWLIGTCFLGNYRHVLCPISGLLIRR